MTDPANDRRSTTIGALLRAGAPGLSALGQRAGWVRLRAALDRRGPGARRRSVLMAVAVCGAVAASLLVVGVATRQGARERAGMALSYSVERGEIEQSGEIRSDDPAGARVRFSDGSSVDLKAAARAHVIGLHSRGARIALSDGELAVNVAHRPATRWEFVAGPFTVFVEGTSFSLRWTAARERLDLRMYTGVVAVKGPVGGETIRVRGGETLVVRLPERSISVAVSSPSGAPPELSRPGLPDPGLPGAARTDEAAHQHDPASDETDSGPTDESTAGLDGVHPLRAVDVRHSGTGIGSRWREWIASGRSASVVADAERRGLVVTVARGSRDDLAALADAARYSRRNAVARRALHALRDRFATSESAHDAAFFLGRLEEADDARSPRSLEWYRRYRVEAPRGLYVSDSLGREMLIMKRLYGDEGARSVAREYLSRFPRGHLAVKAAAIATPGARE